MDIVFLLQRTCTNWVEKHRDLSCENEPVYAVRIGGIQADNQRISMSLRNPRKCN